MRVAPHTHTPSLGVITHFLETLFTSNAILYLESKTSRTSEPPHDPFFELLLLTEVTNAAFTPDVVHNFLLPRKLPLAPLLSYLLTQQQLKTQAKHRSPLVTRGSNARTP